MKIKLNPNFYPDRQYVKLVAFDPGKTIGVAHAVLLRQAKGDHNVWDVDFVTWTRAWPTEVSALVYNDLEEADAVIIEDWRLQKKKAQQLIGDPLLGPGTKCFIIGQLHLQGRGAIYTLQQPWAKDQVHLPKELVSGTPRTPHERDALRHLIYYLRKGYSK